MRSISTAISRAVLPASSNERSRSISSAVQRFVTFEFAIAICFLPGEPRPRSRPKVTSILSRNHFPGGMSISASPRRSRNERRRNRSASNPCGSGRGGGSGAARASWSLSKLVGGPGANRQGLVAVRCRGPRCGLGRGSPRVVLPSLRLSCGIVLFQTEPHMFIEAVPIVRSSRYRDVSVELGFCRHCKNPWSNCSDWSCAASWRGGAGARMA